MSRNIYALLVGINNYHPNSIDINNLKGCVNDIETVETYLNDRVSKQYRHIVSLKNEQATYQAIVDGFQQHLSQAGSEDTVLFYFAGHGSQIDAPEPFWQIEPDRLNETIVCHDSRIQGQNNKDLVDKELAYLIKEIAKREPHIVIILDCCHSGSATRDRLQQLDERRVPKAIGKRPMDSYIFPLETLPQLAATTRSPIKNPSGWMFSQGRHIVFSACRDHETAKEYNTEAGKRRGVFSHFLLDTLTQTNGGLSYYDLFQRTNALVRGNVVAQSPQMEAVTPEDLDLPFLGDGAVSDRKHYFTVSYDSQHHWIINAGAIHGITNSSNGEKTVLALFSSTSTADQLGQLAEKVGTAEVVEVLPQLSKLKLNISELAKLPKQTTFKAIVTNQPLPPMHVSLEGNDQGIDRVRDAIKSANYGTPSLYIAEANRSDQARFRVLAEQNQYIVTRPADDRPLVPLIASDTKESAANVVKDLEHIARWLKVVELNRPITGRIPAGALQVKVFEVDVSKVAEPKHKSDTSDTTNVSQTHFLVEKELKDPEIRLSYRYNSETGKWQQPAFRVALKNNSDEHLFCAVFDLTENFSIEPLTRHQDRVIRLNPGQEISLLNSKEEPWIFYGSVPKHRWQQGVTEYKDILKFIACTTDFEPRLLEQGKLGDPPPVPLESASSRGGTLNHVMDRVITRGISDREEDEHYDDWITNQVAFTFVRPLDAVTLDSDSAVSLQAGVTLQPHPGLQAKARLTTIPQSARDLGNHILPPILQADARITQPFQFTAKRGSDPGLSVLELTDVDITTIDSVTPEQPLKLRVENQLLNQNEHLLAIGYDGEFYLPIGVGKNQDNTLEINLERLPEPMQTGERSISGSIRIFFQKIISEKLKLDFLYPILAVAEVHADGTVKYEADIEKVRQRVQQANRILLCTHGIIGDTRSIAEHLGSIIQVDQPQVLTQPYDLILTLDYENLNTPIEENARLLKQRLEGIGLGANHDKILHIVAHSMGGLISRWFIEREGGIAIVQHLFLIGTPNAGSPWSTVHDYATLALAIGLNSLSTIPIPVRLMGVLVSAIEAIDVSLDQMRPNSPFLQTLAASPDPGIPYTILAGNTSIIPAAIDSGLLERLLRKLQRTIELPFLGQPNDIAVSVQSITSVGSDRTPQPQICEVACDHLSYFSSAIGLEVLVEAMNALQQLLEIK